MPTEVIIAMIIAIPVIVFPIAFLRSLNIKGFRKVSKEKQVVGSGLSDSTEKAAVKVIE